MHQIIRLINRNLTVTITPMFLIWQIVFPLIYIFIAGFAYTSLISNVVFQNRSIDYQSYLATGMIGFNIMNSTLVSGTIIWNDRKHGMFEQILVGPFTKIHYIFSNMCTIGIIGFSSAAIIMIIGYPVFFKSAEFNLLTIPIIIFISITGSILFGSIASIISTIIKTSELFNVITNSIFLFFAFASTAFYPATRLPEALSIVFYINPLTYVVDIIRAAIFNLYSDIIVLEIFIIAVLSLCSFFIAIKFVADIDF